MTLGLGVCLFCKRVGNALLGLALWMPTGDFRLYPAYYQLSNLQKVVSNIQGSLFSISTDFSTSNFGSVLEFMTI